MYGPQPFIVVFLKISSILNNWKSISKKVRLQKVIDKQSVKDVKIKTKGYVMMDEKNPPKIARPSSYHILTDTNLQL